MQPVNTSTKKRLVSCPQCGELSEYSSNNPYRPFCSERCRLIDLGQWASENYRIPDTAKPEDIPDDTE
ncbi:DNA gyrase inhibitor YacG [Methylobacillus caricis]|uniref:DNA gyrase inhibitor YacG n=1 Tax=Methylobacillus caricis TaxID=1971611 RepID=UPI00384AD57D